MENKILGLTLLMNKIVFKSFKMYLVSWQEIKETLEAEMLSGFSPCLSSDDLKAEPEAGIQMYGYSLS